MNLTLIPALVLFLPMNLLAASLLPGEADNGKKLHNSTSCISCHTQMTNGKPDQLYTRSDRKITEIGGLMKQVSTCNKFQKVGLDENGVNDVVKYLNESFYKFAD